MISESLYTTYLKELLAGNRKICSDIVQDLLDREIELKKLYSQLFQRSLYQVGKLWEMNKISVANEHLATAITEHLMTLVYPTLFAIEHIGRKAVVSCSANEYHQVGGRMVADLLEINGWDSYFLGANISKETLAQFIQDKQPDVVGLSLSFLSNLDRLKTTIEAIKADFPNMDMLVGGQAFRWGGIDVIKKYPGTEYIQTLDELEKHIKEACND